MKNKFVLLWFGMLMLLSGGACIYLAVQYQFASQGGVSEQGEYSAEDALLAKMEVQKKQKTTQGVGADEKWMTRFELTERSERKIGTKELDGKIHVVSFFFATCPGTCRQQNMHMAELEREFGKQGVKFLAISVDPDTDTPAKLREYATSFNAPKDSWYFLTGDLPYIERVGSEIYNAGVQLKFHYDMFILVDATGKQIGTYAWADAKKFSELKTKIRELVSQQNADSGETPAAEKTTEPAASETTPTETKQEPKS